MEVDYNPQLGYRRTIFQGNYDFLTGISSFESRRDGLYITADTYRGEKVPVKICFFTDTAFRFQMFPDPKIQEGPRPVFSPKLLERAKAGETEDYYWYKTQGTELRFQKKFWEMSVYVQGKLLSKEQVFDTNVDNRWKCLPVGFETDETGNCIKVRENMYLFSDESFWGLGERFTELDKRGRRFQCWQKDALSTNTEDSYKGHPFFISSRGYAVLLNTFTRSVFDMGRTSQVSWQMEAEESYLDYFFFGEPEGDYKALLRQYIDLTGGIPMIPKWAFGFWMSKCSYQNRREIEEVAERAAEYDLPLDVIHIDNWQRKENTGTWEWDQERFPDPEGMIRWLRKRHIHLSLWMYPYLDETSPMFPELEAKGYFVKNREGKTALFYSTADSVSKCGCFDFTNPDFLEWYKGRVMPVLRMGVSVIKTDFSEAVPEDALYWDGTGGIQGHNRLTYLYAETIYRWMEEAGKETGNIPMLWGRSGYAGSHRIPGAWAGDSSSALNNHSALLRGGLSIAMSGVSFWGFDMGGFYSTDYHGNECPPTEEEYVRSVQLGFFMPLSRAHGKTNREPWNFSGRVLDIVRRYDKMRHELIPYLYSSACESHLQGTPMLRPLLLEYPHDPAVRNQELSYMLGDSLLIAPPFERDTYSVCLPQGKWANVAAGEILQGGCYLDLCPGLEELPVFQRENSLVLRLPEEYQSYVPEGPFRELNGTLFYSQEMDAVYYDESEDGKTEGHKFCAYEKDGFLCVDTELRLKRLEVITEKTFRGIVINGRLQSEE